MAKQPCSNCGNWVIVENKLFLSWSKELKEEEKVFCITCKNKIRKSILSK